MATELSSGAISSILEAVPGIATVLRSPIADAIVNLSRSAAGITPFDAKDAHELIRYAVRRGLIRSDEAERVTAEIEMASRAARSAARAAARATPKKVKAPGHRPAARKKAATKAAPKPKKK